MPTWKIARPVWEWSHHNAFKHFPDLLHIPDFIIFKFSTCTMTTLAPPTHVEKKSSRTCRLPRLVLNKNCPGQLEGNWNPCVGSRAIPILCLQNYSCVQYSLGAKWFVQNVPRRVILYAPGASLHQKLTEQRCTFATVKLELLAILRMDFPFELSTLHIFVWRTRLDRREVVEKNVFDQFCCG